MEAARTAPQRGRLRRAVSVGHAHNDIELAVHRRHPIRERAQVRAKSTDLPPKFTPKTTDLTSEPLVKPTDLPPHLTELVSHLPPKLADLPPHLSELGVHLTPQATDLPAKSTQLPEDDAEHGSGEPAEDAYSCPRLSHTHDSTEMRRSAPSVRAGV